MKKILIIFTQIILISSFSFSVSACFNPLTGHIGDNVETKPPDPPIIKDITYYKKLIKTTKKYVVECQEIISTIEAIWKDDKEGKISDEEYQMMHDEISVHLYTYQSEINEYQYQILLLEKKNDKYTLKQIEQGIDIFTEKITNLSQALELKEKYPEHYPETELKIIKDAIKEAIEIKEMFLNLKEEKENKCRN